MFGKLLRLFRPRPAPPPQPDSAPRAVEEIPSFPDEPLETEAFAAPSPVDDADIAIPDTLPTPPTVPELHRAFYRWLLGSPRAEHVRDPEAKLEEACSKLEHIAKTFDVRRMPRLPSLVPQLMAAMRRDNANTAELTALLSRDQILVGEVLRTANSIWYRRPGNPPVTLSHSVQTIGHDGLRRVLLTAVMRPILRSDPSHPGFMVSERLWQMSETRIWLCTQLAVGHCDVSEAQLAGIISGTGTTALLRLADLQLLAQAAVSDAFAQRFRAIARPLSAKAADYWQLPADVQEALDTFDSNPNALSRTLFSADLLAMGNALIQAEQLTLPALAGVDCHPPATTEQRFRLLHRLGLAFSEENAH